VVPEPSTAGTALSWTQGWIGVPLRSPQHPPGAHPGAGLGMVQLFQSSSGGEDSALYLGGDDGTQRSPGSV
jgi:hypothetical protein